MTQQPKVPTPTHALEMLHEEHARMRQLLDECARADPADKRKVADNLIAEAEVHILLAQEYIYPAVERAAQGGQAIEHASRHSGEIDRLAEEMAEISGDDPRFQQIHDGLQALLDEHIAAEEGEVFPQLQKIGDEELVSMGQKMIERREEALHDLTQKTPQPMAGGGGPDI
jgi:hypothetical protein